MREVKNQYMVVIDRSKYDWNDLWSKPCSSLKEANKMMNRAKEIIQGSIDDGVSKKIVEETLNSMYIASRTVEIETTDWAKL